MYLVQEIECNKVYIKRRDKKPLTELDYLCINFMLFLIHRLSSLCISLQEAKTQGVETPLTK